MATCGAKTRSGKPCQSKAMANGRCRMHGGNAKGAHNPARPGNCNAAKPGALYSKFLSEEEQALDLEAERGRLDGELDLARVMLRRALAAQQKANDLPELEEIIERDGDKDDDGKPLAGRTEHKFKRRDYVAQVDRCLARISALERDREELTLKRLAIAKAAKDLEDPNNKGLPEPKQVIIGVEDASLPEAE